VTGAQPSVMSATELDWVVSKPFAWQLGVGTSSPGA
jgi:hypothetical protein